MKKIEHPLFSIEIPDFFDVAQQETMVYVAESESEPYNHQKKRLKVYLDKLSDLNSSIYRGNSLEEKWEDYCLYFFKSEKINTEKTTEKGYEIWKMHAKTDAVFQKDYYKVQYFFATVFLDDTYFLHVEVMYENDAPWAPENWVAQTYDSLQVIGDKENRDAAFRLHVVEAEEAEIQYQKKQQERAQEAEAAKRTREYPIEIPSEGKDYFKVGDFEFEFLEEETNWLIGSLSKDLQVTFKAKTKEVNSAVKKKLLDDYKPDGTVSLTIPAKGIHQNGIPVGSLRFEEEKTNAPLFLHARSEGFDYSLAFSGVVTFKEGWVLLSGEMTKSYHNKSFPIQVAKKFDSSTLNWNDYQFTSMEETGTENPEEVRFLNLVNPDFQTFSDAILRFKNLEELTISQKSPNWEKEKLLFANLPEAIEQLQQLKKIYINGLALQELPEGIATLTALEQLSVNNCDLRTVPKGVWHLPQLKYLWLSSNQLTHIPDDINLPALQNISLDKNQFKTLPENLAKQPALKKIDLKGNPLESLPQAFNEIPEIGLPMEDKLRLLDFGYKGADGKGLVPWNDAMFWSRHDTDLLPEILSVIKENQLNEHAAALESMVKKAIGFTHTGEEDYREIGNHRFGGMPDLPETMPYPRFGDNWRENKDDYVYEFLGQINCEQLAQLQDYLPRTGMLFFFLETIHSVYGGGNNPAKVLYCEDVSNLASGKRFEFTRDDYSEMFDAAYAPYKVKADKMNSAPSFYASYVNKHLFLGEAEKLKEEEGLLDDLYDSFERPINEKNTFQYAVNAHGFTQHEAPELQASLAKKGNPEDWMTLMVFTSAGDMQWGDAGDLFFVIHKSDLAKGDFSNVFVTMESS